MKLLIASDIHGDANCCRKLIDIAEREQAEKILILGDILYHGPRNGLPEGYAPKAVAEMLNGIADKLLCVRGNCDTEVDQAVLHFPIMSETAFVYINSDRITLFMSHGHKYSPDNLPPLTGGTVFLYGHTHILGKCEKNGIVCINPGSVSIPKGGNEKTCAIYNDGIIEIISLEGKVIEKHNLKL